MWSSATLDGLLQSRRMRQLQRFRLTRLYTAAVLALLTALGLAAFQVAQRSNERQLAARTRALIAELDAATFILDEAEGSVLEFVLTGDERRLAAFDGDGPQIVEHLTKASMMLDGDSVMQNRIRALLLDASRSLGNMQLTVSARRSESGSTEISRLRTRVESIDVTRVRDTVHAIESDQRRLLEVREASLDRTLARTLRVEILLGLIGMGLLAIGANLVRTARRLQQRAERELVHANEELQTRVDELIWRGRVAASQHKLSESLQLCVSVTEAYDAIGQLMPAIVGTESRGELAVFSRSDGPLECVARWNQIETEHERRDFHREDCYALRSGKPYHARSDHLGLRCTHVPPEWGEYVCLPLSAHGEVFGFLSVGFPPHYRTDGKAEEHLSLVLHTAEQVAIALANLTLRERLKQQTIRDALTATFNRRYFDTMLATEIERTHREESSLALLMLDIDHFKSINDRFGHDVGDEVLRQIADRVSHAVRAEDIVCRYGGEEFAILLPDVTPAVARARAQAIVATCGASEIRIRSASVGTVTVSVGLAMSRSSLECGDDLVRRADAALYEAKRSGRNRVAEQMDLEAPVIAAVA